jgi:8-amino-3,8-dideoxy-alpha-D-manno-octulosonate transaminase
MPGYEMFNEEEKKQVLEVLDSGILMRYGFDILRNNHWKAKELEHAICEKLNVNMRSKATFLQKWLPSVNAI